MLAIHLTNTSWEHVSWTANLLGVSALIGFVVAFYPVIANILKKNLHYKKLIPRRSQLTLITTIFLGLIHGLLMTQKNNIDFNQITTYWTYAEGLLTLNLLIFFAFTFSELELNLKKITYFTYAVLFFLGCHIWQEIVRFW